MAAVQAPSMTPDATVSTSFGATSSRVTLPGTPASDAYILVTNLGPLHISVKLGDNTVVATTSTCLAIPAGQSLALTIGTTTYIAGITHGSQGQGSTVNITSGN